MKKKILLEKIINLVKEQMAASAVGPTNRTGDAVKNFDPVMGTVKKRKPTPLGRYRTRVTWKKKDES